MERLVQHAGGFTARDEPDFGTQQSADYAHAKRRYSDLNAVQSVEFTTARNSPGRDSSDMPSTKCQHASNRTRQAREDSCGTSLWQGIINNNIGR